MAKQYIQLYYDYLDALEELTDAERGRLFVSLLKYGMTGATEKLSGNERYLYSIMKKQIDRDSEAYDKRCQENKENGRLGGRPKKPNGFEENQTVLEKPKKKEKEKEKEKVSECPASPPAAPAQQQNTYGEFGRVCMTEFQRQMLVDRFGEAMATDYINRLDRHIASSGKLFESHYATMLQWIDQDMRKEKAEKEKTSAPPKQKPSRFANFKQREWNFEEIEKNERRWLESQLKSNGG